MLTKKEQKCLYETRLRNLKRKYARLTQHPELVDDALEVKSQIREVEDLLQ